MSHCLLILNVGWWSAAWGTQRMAVGVPASMCSTRCRLFSPAPCILTVFLTCPGSLRSTVCLGVYYVEKMGKSCQYTSLIQVCQITSVAEENLVSNHMQIGPKLLVMPWCQLWFLIHYLVGFNVYMPDKFSLLFLSSHGFVSTLFVKNVFLTTNVFP